MATNGNAVAGPGPQRSSVPGSRRTELGSQATSSRSAAPTAAAENLEFDHRNPATKSLTIGKRACFSRAKLLREIAKCDVRCRPCHMKRPNHGRVTRR
jgi:hypothetical protein